MKRAVIDTTIIVCLVAQLPFSLANAAGIRTIDTFGPVVDKVEAYATEYGGDRVLLVADIDNTLLAMDRQLGSDQWFQWQEHLLEHEPQSPYLVADDFSGLLEVQGLLFATTRMHPPEPEQPRQNRRCAALGRLHNGTHLARRRLSRGGRARAESSGLRFRQHFAGNSPIRQATRGEVRNLLAVPTLSIEGAASIWSETRRSQDLRS